MVVITYNPYCLNKIISMLLNGINDKLMFAQSKTVTFIFKIS